MTSFKSLPEFITLSMKRSGHHAIMHWIMCNMDHNFIHYNCCFIKNNNIIPMGGNNVMVYDEKNQITNYRKKNIGYKTIEKNNPHITAKMYNFEDYPASILNNKLIVGKKIVIMRDLYNMLSSSLKQNKKSYGGKIFKQRINKWLSHMEIIKDENILFINYNKWFNDKNYRDTISSLLNFTNKDKGLDYVPHFGKGSSFDQQNKNGRDMAVLERYKFLNESNIKEIKNHDRFPEIYEFNKKVFSLDFNEIFKL